MKTLEYITKILLFLGVVFLSLKTNAQISVPTQPIPSQKWNQWTKIQGYLTVDSALLTQFRDSTFKPKPGYYGFTLRNSGDTIVFFFNGIKWLPLITSVDLFKRNDSIFLRTNGTTKFVYKDSIGTGSGSGLTTVAHDLTLLGQGTLANVLRVDTNVIATMNKLRDSMALIRTLIPKLTAGSNISITGTFPNLTISAVGGSGGGDIDSAATVGSGVPVFKEKTGPLLIFHNIGKDSTMNVVLAGDSIQLGVNLNVIASKYYVDTAKQNIRNLIPNITAGTDISITGSFPNVVINNTGTSPIDTLPTIAALQNYNGTAKMIFVTDNYRGGLFYHTPLTPTADSGIVLNAYVKGGRFIRRWDQVFMNITWFGIHPDSTAVNNSTKLRYLNAFVKARNGANIYIPEGTYLFRRGGSPAQIFLLSKNTRIIGAGIEKTILKLDPTDTTNFRRMIAYDNTADVDNTEVAYLSIDMSGIHATYPPPGSFGTDAQNAGIFCYSDNFKIKNAWFHDLYIHDVTGDIIGISTNTEDVVIERIVQRDYLRQGISIGGTGGTRNIHTRNLYDRLPVNTIGKGGESYHIEPYDTVRNVTFKESIVYNFTGSGTDGLVVEDVTTIGTGTNVANNVKNITINRLNSPNQALQVSFNGDGGLLNNIKAQKLYLTLNGGTRTPKNVHVTNSILYNPYANNGLEINNVTGVNITNSSISSDSANAARIANSDSTNFNNVTFITKGASSNALHLTTTVSSQVGIGTSFITNCRFVSPFTGLRVTNQSIILGESNIFDAPSKFVLEGAATKVFPYFNSDAKRILNFRGTGLPTYGRWDAKDEIIPNNITAGSVYKYIATNSGYLYRDTGWNAAFTYYINDYVKGSNDSIYVAKTAGGQAENPILDSDNTYWVSVKSKTKAIFRTVGIIGLYHYGAGDPNGVVAAAVGSIYHRSNPPAINGIDSTIYVKVSGTETSTTVWRPLKGTAGGGVTPTLDTIYRKAGTDSVFYTVSGVTKFAFRDSIGSGGTVNQPSTQIVVGTGSGISSYSAFTYSSVDSILRVKRIYGDSYGLAGDSGTVRGISYAAGGMRIRANSITFATESGGTNILNLTSTGRLGLTGITAPTAVIHIPASNTTRASIRVVPGVAPTSPNIGDIYVNSVDNHPYIYDGTVWIDLAATGGGGGITALTGDVTASGTGSVAATIAANAVSNSKFRQSVGLSVVGRNANSTGNVADIAAASDYQVLRRDGTTIGFGAIRLNQGNAVTGSLGVNNGGTGLSSIGIAGQFIRVNLAGNALEFYTVPASSLYFRNSGTTGASIYQKQTDTTAYFRKLIGGTNVNISQADSNITISVPTIDWSSVTGTPTMPTFAEGIYSATTSSLGNLTTAQATDLNWYRTGSNVTIYGNILVNVGDINEPTDFEMTIPPTVTQTFNSTDKQVGGGAEVLSVTINETSAVHMTAVPSTNRIQFRWNSKATGNQNISFSVTYKLASLD